MEQTSSFLGSYCLPLLVYMLSWAGGCCSNSLHNFRFYFLSSDVDWVRGKARQDARTCAVCVGARQRLGCGAGTEEVRERLSVYPCRQPPLHTPPPCYLLGLHARHNLSPCSLSSPLYFRVMEISVAVLVFFRDEHIPSSSLPSSSIRSNYADALHRFFLLLLLLTLDYPMVFTGSLFFSYDHLLLLTIDHHIMLLTGSLLFFFGGDMFGSPALTLNEWVV